MASSLRGVDPYRLPAVGPRKQLKCSPCISNFRASWPRVTLWPDRRRIQDHRCLPGAVLGVMPGKARWLLWHQRYPGPLLGAHEGELLRGKEDLPDLQFEYFSSRALQGWLSARPQLKYHLLVWPSLMPPPPGPKLILSLLDFSFRHVSI